MKTTIRYLISVIIFGFLIVVFFLFISSRYSVFFGLRTFNVLTGSMVPKIQIGSLVITRPMPDYPVGTIITFNRANITVTHRIVGMKNGEFITKGDANKIADLQLVNKKDVIGEDILIIPNAGKIIDFIKSIPGFIIFIVIPTIIFIVFEAIEFKREWEKEVEKKVLRRIEEAKQT